MDIFLTVLGVFLGIILAIFVVIAILYFKLKSTIGTQNMNELKSVVSNISNLQKEEYVREKNVKGMTKLLEPEIMRDFPEFNKDLIFSMCESNLRKIFNAIESQDVTAINNDEEFIYLREKIDQQIEDMKSNNVIEKFDNIEFNRHAIMAYNKNNGKATIKISTTLGYYYKTNRTDKKSYENIKKQTRENIVKKLIQILGIVALAIVVILNIVYTADMNSGEQISIKFSGFIYIIGLIITAILIYFITEVINTFI